MDDILYLIGESEDKEKDEYGIDHAIPYPPRMVYCHVKSISRSEFFAAGRNGLNPEYQFTVFTGDYKGELVLEYRNKRYSIYRTYQKGDVTEIYAERKGGINGKNKNYGF